VEEKNEKICESSREELVVCLPPAEQVFLFFPAGSGSNIIWIDSLFGMI
jgi:hypothetical protein